MSKAKTNSMSAIERLKKAHQVMSIQKKDLSLKDFFTGKTTEVEMEVIAISSKYVAKYDKSAENGSRGFHTTIYLKDGRITGAFSNSLLDLAQFFYKSVGMNPDSEFNYLSFKTEQQPDAFIKLLVSKIDLDQGFTYNFRIQDGIIGQVERIGDPSQSNVLALTEGEFNSTEE
jgi:hypothetical protein